MLARLLVQLSKSDSRIHKYTSHWHSNACMCKRARSQLLTTRSGFSWHNTGLGNSVCMPIYVYWTVNNSTITCTHLHRQLPTQVIYILLWQLPYFFDQTPRWHFSAASLFLCGYYLRATFISLQTARVRYTCTSDTVTTAGSCQHTRSLPFLLPTV